jgi:NAD(P)-dependent dehydrogenase (short-subunit alcohol dehydrogenase family)
MAKYGMSMCVLGMAEEFKGTNIAVNALWPQTGNFNFFKLTTYVTMLVNMNILSINFPSLFV